jgi:hypothetical protein
MLLTLSTFLLINSLDSLAFGFKLTSQGINLNSDSLDLLIFLTELVLLGFDLL